MQYMSKKKYALFNYDSDLYQCRGSTCMDKEEISSVTASSVGRGSD